MGSKGVGFMLSFLFVAAVALAVVHLGKGLEISQPLGSFEVEF